MTVSQSQRDAAVLNKLDVHAVAQLAQACEDYGLPFWLGCTILQKETSGQNIYGHDAGGTFSFSGVNQGVSESNFQIFWRLVKAGGKSNGVGPMQLTWKGFFEGAASKQGMLELGLRPWDIGDNIRYAVKYILAPSWKKEIARPGATPAKAVFAVGRTYNGKDSYGTDALSKAKLWIVRVGYLDQPQWKKI